MFKNRGGVSCNGFWMKILLRELTCQLTFFLKHQSGGTVPVISVELTSESFLNYLIENRNILETQFSKW